MKTHIALLRGVMPFGKNKVPMAQLRELLAAEGFENVRTYIASGNVLVDTALSQKAVAERIHDLIKQHIGPDLRIVVRTPQELERALTSNPFPHGQPNQVLVTFFADPLPDDFMQGVSTPGREEVVAAEREVYIHYPDMVGRSKLKLPKVALEGTARNLNTIQKLIELAKD